MELLPDSKIKKSKKKKKSSHSPRKSSQNSRKNARSISPHLNNGNKNYFGHTKSNSSGSMKDDPGAEGESPTVPQTKFFTRYGVSKPYEVPPNKKRVKAQRFIFNEKFAPSHKVMVQRSNISYIKETHAIEPADDPRLG